MHSMLLCFLSSSQELLSLFGLPFLVAPEEAEAQCAALEQNRLIQGCITDDNDVFLFGGKTVYRNFFSQNKVLEMYQVEDIENRLCKTLLFSLCPAKMHGWNARGLATTMYGQTDFGNEKKKEKSQLMYALCLWTTPRPPPVQIRLPSPLPSLFCETKMCSRST